MNTKLKWQWQRLRWAVADWFSYLACRLRGQPWYLGDTWAGVPGNRAAELRQCVWERIVALNSNDYEWLDKIDRDLTELGQMAGENWGHFPRPK